MATDIIETALASALEELEKIKKIEEEQKAMFEKLTEKMDGMEKRLTEQIPVPVQPLKITLEAAIMKGIVGMQQMVEAQPKTVIHECRILLFSEYNAGEYLEIPPTVITRFYRLLTKKLIAINCFVIARLMK